MPHPQTRTLITMLTVPAGWSVLSVDQIEDKMRRMPELMPHLAREVHRMLAEPDILEADVIANKILSLAKDPTLGGSK